MNRTGRMLQWILGVMLIGGLAGSAWGQDEKKPGPNAEEPGENLFKTYCASCHGTHAKGDGPAAKALKKKPADLTQITRRRKGEFQFVEIASIIDGRTKMDSHGSRTMPIWGKRFGEEVEGQPLKEELVSGNLLMLVLYLQSIQK